MAPSTTSPCRTCAVSSASCSTSWRPTTRRSASTSATRAPSPTRSRRSSARPSPSSRAASAARRASRRCVTRTSSRWTRTRRARNRSAPTGATRPRRPARSVARPGRAPRGRPSHSSPAAGHPPADPDGAVHPEDHQRAGADRCLPPGARAAARGAGQALHTRAHHRAVRDRHHRGRAGPPAAGAAAGGARRRGGGDDLRPRLRRSPQRQHPAHRRGAAGAAARGRRGAAHVRGRAQGGGYYRFRRRELTRTWTGVSDQPRYDNAREIAETVLTAFLEHEVDEIHMVFADFVTAMVQRPTAVRVIPLVVEPGTERPPQPLPMYVFEPDVESVLNALLPRYVAARIFTAMLESAASEWSARRRAMSAATDNAEQLVESLTREYNQARQAAITQEIMEIVGGAEALQSGS